MNCSRSHRWVAVSLWFALLPVVAACDGRGTSAASTKLPDQVPTRIVSLSPAATEALFAVGCGKQLVLRDAWSDWPADALAVPAVAGFSPSAESILAARPELVLVHFPSPNLRQALQGAGVRWLAFAPQTLDEVADSLAKVGEACGQRTSGAVAAQKLRTEVQQVRDVVAELPKAKVFYEMDASDPNKPYTVAAGSFGHDLLLAAGATNVFGSAKVPWLQVTTEAVLAADPDLIVLADSDAELQAQTAAMVAARPGWDALRAVRKLAIVPVPGQLLGRPGPRIGEALRQLAVALHPEVTGQLAGPR